jgi:hypothetical protein
MNTREQGDADFVSMYNMQISLTEIGANWFNIDADQEKEIRDIASRNNPASQRAKAILNLVFSESYPFEWALPGKDGQRSTQQESILPLFQVYPNPADDEVNIVMLGGNNECWNLQLTDLFGRVMENFINAASGTLTINVHGFANGIYMLRKSKDGLAWSELYKLQIQRTY